MKIKIKMKEAEYDKLISQLEAEASSVKYDFQIADAINKIIEEQKGKLTPRQEQQLKWEYLLFRLMTKNSFASDGLKTERFKPMATFTDGSIFPDPDGFPDTALGYFESRTVSSTNPILKARYLDFLWEKSKSKNKHLFARESIDQYLLTVDEYDNEDAIMERLDGLQRATELCLIFESKLPKRPLTKKVVAKLVEQIDKTAQTGNYRWLIEMFELVLALPSFFSQKQIKDYIALCKAAAAHYHSDQNFHLQRSFLDLKAEMTKLLKISVVKQKAIQEEIGQSFIDEAEAKSASGLVKIHFLQEAIQHYSKLGNKQKVNELIAEVKAATKQAIDNKEFKELSSTIKIDSKVIEKMKASLGTGEEVPERMGTLPTFFPNWDHAVKLTAKLSKKYVFQHLVGTVHYGSRYPISRPQTPEEVQEDHVMQNFKIEAELALKWLTGFLAELIKEGKVSLTDFQKFFSKLQVVDKDTYETVLVGLDSYFKGDHFHAAYVLTLQLEDFLRYLLAVFGGQTTVPEAGAFREKTLGSVLVELKPYFSDLVYHYISWVTEDYRGFNLRNNIAHGFFKKKHANPIYSTAILHIFCLLIANTKISVKEQKKDEK
ncbi:MAG TPA: DUF4209 domain-containing protein [Patescibacteria group bacterium]|nr:DUF4209 domain-containing protein [Patescibacteria group bacterium]